MRWLRLFRTTQYGAGQGHIESTVFTGRERLWSGRGNWIHIARLGEAAGLTQYQSQLSMIDDDWSNSVVRRFLGWANRICCAIGQRTWFGWLSWCEILIVFTGSSRATVIAAFSSYPKRWKEMLLPRLIFCKDYFKMRSVLVGAD